MTHQLPTLCIGIDMGTSGCRALAMEATTQKICGQFQVALPAPVRYGKICQQDPLDWWACLCQTLTGLGQCIPPAKAAFLAVDGTSGSLLLANTSGEPIGLALLYCDTQAESEFSRLKSLAPSDSVVVSSGSSLAKLLYLCKKCPHNSSPRYALHQADWLMGRLLGRYGYSDENNALKLGYDVHHRCWPTWLDILDIGSLLPQIYPPGSPLGVLLPTLAQRFSLPVQTTVVAGTTDSTAAFLATGATEIGDAVSSLGTTLVLKVFSNSPIFCPEFGIYSHRLGDRWLCGGASNVGGAVFQSLFSQQQINVLSTKLRPDCPTGLDYYPLPAKGERFPTNDPTLTPKLTPRPKEDVVFFQAILEGIARIEKQGYQRLAEVGAGYPKSVRSVGGGASNQAWTQIRERFLGVPMLQAGQQEAAYGSALLAQRAFHSNRSLPLGIISRTGAKPSVSD